jgi:hypothetical protein
MLLVIAALKLVYLSGPSVLSGLIQSKGTKYLKMTIKSINRFTNSGGYLSNALKGKSMFLDEKAVMH